jgi:hypothetical protein
MVYKKQAAFTQYYRLTGFELSQVPNLYQATIVFFVPDNEIESSMALGNQQDSYALEKQDEYALSRGMVYRNGQYEELGAYEDPDSYKLTADVVEAYENWSGLKVYVYRYRNNTLSFYYESCDRGAYYPFQIEYVHAPQVSCLELKIDSFPPAREISIFVESRYFKKIADFDEDLAVREKDLLVF